MPNSQTVDLAAADAMAQAAITNANRALSSGTARYPIGQGSPDNNFTTPLTDKQRAAFQQWKQKYAPNDSGDDYDLEGAFRAGLTPDPETGHWPDTFKKPNHPTFSTESMYAQYAPDQAGNWDAQGNYVPSAARAQAEASAVIEAQNAEADKELPELQAQDPGRYSEVDAADLPQWQKDWQSQNQSSGIVGDTWKLLGAGQEELEQSINDLMGRVPVVGKTLQSLSDNFDRWAYGSKSTDQRLQDNIDRDIATLTPETKAARDAQWWDTENNRPGPAFLNPRSYYAGVVESLPSTVATMAPGALLAKGAYAAALGGKAAMAAGERAMAEATAKGLAADAVEKAGADAASKVAAGAAAKTALFAGMVTEGAQGGAQSARQVEQQILAMPRDQLLASDAAKSLKAQGMSDDDIVKAIASDGATQALILGGVATGAFGGTGDLVLTRLIAEGVGGGLVRRIATGAARGVVGEGVLEELPQNAAQQVGQNLAIRNTADPNQDLMEGVPEQALGGAAIGAVMGGAMGGAGGALRRSDVEPAPVEEEGDGAGEEQPGVAVAAAGGQAASGPAPVPPATASQPAPQGPLAAAVVHGLASAPGALDEAGVPVQPPVAGETRTVPDQNPVAVTPVDPGDLPRPGSNVVVETGDLPRFTGRVQSYEQGDDGQPEAVVETTHPETGEVASFQVPVSSLRTAKLTDQLIAQMDARDNPPAPSTSPPGRSDLTRQFRGVTLVMPDEKHAQLYDFGQQMAEQQLAEQQRADRVLGNDALRSRELFPDQRRQIADTFEIPEKQVNNFAANYRKWTQQVAVNNPGAALPIQASPANKEMLQRYQLQRLREEKAAGGAGGQSDGGTKPAAGATLANLDPTRAWGEVGQKTAPELRSLADEVSGAGDDATASELRRFAKILDDMDRTNSVLAGDTAPAQGATTAPATESVPLPPESGSGAAVSAESPSASTIDAAAHEAATSPQNELPEPTQPQKEAGNYRKGHFQTGGLDISIENPIGSTRSGVARNGKRWSVQMKSHYGYIRGTVGKDKDHVDVFVKSGTSELGDGAPVFVVDQVNPDGGLDEHKVMLGWQNAPQARKAYLANYGRGWKGLGAITQTTLGELKAWLKEGDTSKPFAARAGVSEPATGAENAPVSAESAPSDGAAAEPSVADLWEASAYPSDREEAAETLARRRRWEEQQATAGSTRGQIAENANKSEPVESAPAEPAADAEKPDREDAGEDARLGELERRATEFSDPLALVERHFADPEGTDTGLQQLRQDVRRQESALRRKYDNAPLWDLEDRATPAEAHFLFQSDADSGWLGELSAMLEPVADRGEAVDELRRVSSSLPESPDYDAADRSGKLAIGRLAVLGHYLADFGLTPQEATREVAEAIAGRYQDADDALFMARDVMRRMAPYLGDGAEEEGPSPKRIASRRKPDAGDQFSAAEPNPTEAQRQEIDDIVRQVSGLSDVQWRNRITIPAGNSGWGTDAPIDAAGRYSPSRDAIALVEGLATSRTAYHEAFHRLQHLFLTPAEERVLIGERPKLRRIIASDPARRDQFSRMSPSELEAEAFAIWAAGRTEVKPYRTIAVAWGKMKAALERVANFLRGAGFQTSEDIFTRAASGEVAGRSGSGGAGGKAAAFQPAGAGPDAATQARLRQLLETARKPGNSRETVEIGPVSPAVADVLKARGVDVSGYTHTVDVSAIRHILNRHADAATEAGRGQLPVTDADIEAIPALLAGARHIVTGVESPRGLPVIGYIAQAADGTTLYIEEARTGRRQLATLSMRKYPAARDFGSIAETLLSNARSDGGGKPNIVEVGTSDNDEPGDAEYSRAEGVRLRGAVTWLGETAAGRWIDSHPALLGAVPLNYFTELARPNMTAVAEYLRIKRNMDAYRGTKHAKADQLAQEWLKFIRLGFGLVPSADGKAAGQRLAGLMHDSTLAGVDPSRTDEESVAHPAYAGVRKRYMALAPAGRTLYAKVRDAYVSQAEELDKLLIEAVRKSQAIADKQALERYEAEIQRIRHSGLEGLELKDRLDKAAETFGQQRARSGYANKARLSQLRKSFEASRVPAPYFPLARFGDYFVAVRDVDGTLLSFSRREHAADRDRLARELKKQFPAATIKEGALDKSEEVQKAMDPRILAEIQHILGENGVDDAIMDAIWQRYLQSMPDLSTRKRFIHRQGVAGFDQDALRAFSSHMFHAAHQMARVKYGLDLQETLDQAKTQAEDADDATRGMRLTNELALRHKWVMNPTGRASVQAITSAMFMWHLALSPASALVNLTQTPMIQLPILAARYGMGKSSAELLRASRDFIAGRGNAANANLSQEERWALEKFHESGLIERTRSHDLAGVGNTGVNYSPLRARVMAIMSWGFHVSEIANREVSALAAYRLARGDGMSPDAALDIAHDLVWKGQFDYANSSRARYLQGDAAKLLGVFQSYQLNMLYRLFRDIHQSFAGETAQARKEARYQLAGMMGMMVLMGGITGFFGYSYLMLLAGAFFDDKNDPFTFEDEMKRHLADLFGPDISDMILKGVPGHLLHVDLTSRVGMPDFFVRAPDDPNLDGRDWWGQMLLDAAGVVPSTIVNAGDGFDLLRQGKTIRGLELIAPKWAKDLMQAYRFANEGLTTRNNDQIMPRDQISAWDTIAKTLGFQPADIAETYERNSALKDAEQRLLDDRSQLLNRLALATEMLDEDGRARALEAIRSWNAVPAHRPVAITGETISRSLATRRRNAAKREDGVYISNQALSRELRGMMPERSN